MITAYEAWRDLIIAVLTDDKRVPCTGPERELWTSDRTVDRLNAAHRCGRCPVLRTCARYADLAVEQFHVYGGHDRADRPPLPMGNGSTAVVADAPTAVEPPRGNESQPTKGQHDDVPKL